MRGTRPAMGAVAMVIALMAGSACGAAAPGSQVPKHPEPCLALGPASPLPALESPVPIPEVGTTRVTLVIDGHAVADEVLDNALAGARQRQDLDPRLFHAEAKRRPDLLTMQRGAVAGIVLGHMEECQGATDGIKPDAGKAEAGAREQLKAYRDSLLAYEHPSPVPSPTVVPLPGGRPAVVGQVQPPAPAAPPPIPGGLTAEAYYLSPAYIDFLEATQVRRGEEQRILAAAAGQPRWKALGEWMRAHLGEYRVKVGGLGDFSIPDAYEASGQYISPS